MTKPEHRLDRELVQVTTLDAAQRTSPEVTDYTNAFYRALLKADRELDQQQDDDAFFERLTGSKPGLSTREFLFGKESK
jgi:hypothetical protein